MFQFLLSFVLLTTAFAKERPDCAPDLAEDVAHAAARAAEPQLRARGFGRRAGGYAILIGAMVASAAATTYLTTQLPPHVQFLSQLIGQVSTLGVYVFGAPIWEPLSSAFRKFAFGIEGRGGGRADPRLEAQWLRTQNTYSINEQMSRGVVNAFVTAVRQNFYEAHRAMRDDDVGFAVDQVAEAAVRLRLHFADLTPDEPAVTLAVRASFTAHARVDATFRRAVEKRIQEFDAGAHESSADAHYAATLDAWLR